MNKPHWDRPVNSGPRPCLIDVGFPQSGPRDRTSTSDLKRHAWHTAQAPSSGRTAAPASSLPRSKPVTACRPALCSSSRNFDQQAESGEIGWTRPIAGRLSRDHVRRADAPLTPPAGTRTAPDRRQEESTVPTTCPAFSEGARNRSRHCRQTPVKPGSRTLCKTPWLASHARGRRFETRRAHDEKQLENDWFAVVRRRRPQTPKWLDGLFDGLNLIAEHSNCGADVSGFAAARGAGQRSQSP